MGSEWTRSLIEGSTPLSRGKITRFALIGETASDVRDVMINGDSGILACSPPDFRPTYISNRKSLQWPNGVEAKVFSGIEPDQLRGPQFEAGWIDELCKFRYAEMAWDMFQMGLRLGDHPRCLVTTTPRNIKVLKDIIADPSTAMVKGTTYENQSNLASGFFDYIARKYEGTRLGRQELHADVLSDVPGALWSIAQLDQLRVKKGKPSDYGCRRSVISIDPPVTSGDNADECGIIFAGVAGDVRNQTAHGYVFQDYTTQGQTPRQWAEVAVKAFHRHQADMIIAEVNNGGELVGEVIKQVDPTVPYKAVRASKGKFARAEPVSAIYEQGRVHHVGTHATLEDQMSEFAIDGLPDPSASPDRVDALVWAITELMITPMAAEPKVRSL
jgi:phage terminase large subunit-like protein